MKNHHGTPKKPNKKVKRRIKKEMKKRGISTKTNAYTINRSFLSKMAKRFDTEYAMCRAYALTLRKRL